MQIEFEGQTYEFPDDATDDEIAAALETAAPAQSAGPVSTLTDTALAVPSGLARGAAETAMLPVSLSRMGQDAAGWLYDKAESGVRSLVGADPVSDADRAKRDEFEASLPSTQLNDLIFGAQDKVRGAMDSVLYEPKTTPGKFAGTIAEFAAPGGLPSKAARNAPGVVEKAGRYAEDVVGNVVAPAILSEGAGQLAEGTDYEGAARLAGAVGGNVATAGARAYNAPEAIVRRATGDVSDAQWQRARDLQNNPTGIRLTGPEAIAQATDGATALPNVQRYVEGSVDGRARTAPFFADRPGQVDAATGGVLDLIAPQAADPFTLGPRAANAAGEVVDGVRQDINAQTRPLYQAAEPQVIPDAEFAPIQADPRFQAGLQRLRDNPELAPEYANLPDNSVGVVDAVTKDLFARGEAMAERANPLYGPELGARSTNSATAARETASRSSPEYAQALAEQEALRASQLDPVQQGPVGKVAAAKDTAGAGNAILPQNPMTGSGPATEDAVRRLIAQDEPTTRGVVRQNLGDRYQKAATETQEGSREFAGAKFHKDVAGNEAKQEVLDAVLRAIPNGPTNEAAQLLDVLRATGRRKQIGSATSFNDSIADELTAMNGRGQAAATIGSAGLNIPTQLNDWLKRTGQRKSLGALADLFTDPQSVDLLRNAANRGIDINLGEAVMRSLAEAPLALDQGRP